jgi:CheY-like chemotaxis protein
MRESLSQVLRSLGCFVAAVADRSQLAQALDADNPPDVVLADYHLDDGDTGIDAVRALFRERALDVPVVVLSADDSPETRDRARAAGFRFLPKPVSAARLRALLVALRGES